MRAGLIPLPCPHYHDERRKKWHKEWEEEARELKDKKQAWVVV